MASGAGLGECGLGELSQALRGRGEDRPLFDQVVPDFQKSHLGVAANPPDIGFDHRARRLFGISPVATEKERGNRGARGQPLEIPFPRPGKNLVEIVDCENEVALRRREQAEIHQMHIAAGHHLEIGARRVREISRHDRSASPQKRERRSQHTCHSHRHELLDAGGILRLKNRNRVGASARGSEFRMGRARYITAKRPPIRHPFSARKADCAKIVEPRELGPACILVERSLRAWACAQSYSFAGQRRATTAAGYALSKFDFKHIY